MKKVLSLKEKLALLDKALSEHTPESLKAELDEYPAIGPTLNEFALSLEENINNIKRGANNG